MKREFAALRFFEDANISDRLYWYLAGFPLTLGEQVLAPVGSHDRLQAARVERLLTAEEKDAPYDLRLLKRVQAKLGARKFVLGEELLEFGGVRYDEKHYTPFKKLLLAHEVPKEMGQIFEYGITKTLQMSADDPTLYTEIAHSLGGVLLIGAEGEKTFRALYALLRGEGSLPADEETVRLIKEMLR